MCSHFSVTIWLQMMLVFIAGARRMGHLGPSWAILEISGDYLGSPWDHPGHFCPSWAHFGKILGYLRCSWDHLGTIWGPCWDHLRSSWAILGPFRCILGASLGNLAPPAFPGWFGSMIFGRFGLNFGAILGPQICIFFVVF